MLDFWRSTETSGGFLLRVVFSLVLLKADAAPAFEVLPITCREKLVRAVLAPRFVRITPVT